MFRVVEKVEVEKWEKTEKIKLQSTSRNHRSCFVLAPRRFFSFRFSSSKTLFDERGRGEWIPERRRRERERRTRETNARKTASTRHDEWQRRGRKQRIGEKEEKQEREQRRQTRQNPKSEHCILHKTVFFFIITWHLERRTHNLRNVTIDFCLSFFDTCTYTSMFTFI